MTLQEIERAVALLPPRDQEQLLRDLGARLRRHRAGAATGARAAWIDRLAELRGSIGSGRTTHSSEQFLTESREERG